MRDLPAWGDREIARFKFRAALFQRRGLDERYAEELADRCFERDYERDDRRMCIECSHFQRDGGCFAARQGWIRGADRRLTPIPDLLLRCECFDWARP